MVQSDNFYSSAVGWTKIILPLTALALLSTMFLFARNHGEADEIPFAEIDALAREQRITAPTFSGLTDDGSIIALTAQSAQPQSGDLTNLTISKPRLTIDASDGTSLQIIAGEGVINDTTKQAQLSGLARIETSNGYRMETLGLVADLISGTVTSNGALEIAAPFGRITAGQVQFTLGENDTGQQMHFTNGVRLLYTPQTIGSE